MENLGVHRPVVGCIAWLDDFEANKFERFG